MTIYHQTYQFHLPSTRPSYAPSLPLEPSHGTLNIHPDIDAHRLQASIEWTLISNVNTAQEITFDAVDLQIIRIQSTSADITTNYDGHKLTISLSEPVAKGDSVSYRLITKSMHRLPVAILVD